MSDAGNRRGETALIAHYFAPLCHPDFSFGLSDDVAAVDVPQGCQLVLTKDMLVADVHFFADDDPSLIARKALRVNLSDLAAKGAEPLGYLLGLGLPENWTEQWLKDFCTGLAQDQSTFNFPLLGGDTVKCAERLTLSITAFGLAKKGRIPLRKNARPGDNVYVTGTIGDSALGLCVRRGEALCELLTEQARTFLLSRFLLPQPRIACADLITTFASASMDISDGLLGDAAKMASAASVALKIDAAALPLSSAAQILLDRDPDWSDRIVTGGDDYELLFCASPEHDQAIKNVSATQDIQITRIGQVCKGNGVQFLDKRGHAKGGKNNAAYEHF